MKKHTLIISLITLITYSVSAQKSDPSEYFITNTGDSINGEIKRKFDQNQQPFYQFTSKNGRIYEPNQVSSFQTQSGDLFFNSIAKEGFARQILTGELDLYKVQENFIIKDKTDSVYLLQEKKDTIKSGNRIFVKENNQWVGILRLLTKECNELQMEELRFNEKYIIEYLQKYHNCIGKSYHINNEISDWIKTEIGISFGLSNNNLRVMQESSTFRYYPENTINRSYFGGIDFFISVPRSSMNLSYSTGLYFHGNTFTSEFETEDEALYFNSKISYSMLTVPLMINYSVAFNQFEFMLSAGTQINALYGKEVSLIQVDLNDDSAIPLSENEYLNLSSVNLGLTGKIAIFRNINGSRVGFFASYESTTTIGSGSYNNSQDYIASLGMAKVGIQIIK